jgi:hypothetical protein
MYRCQLQIAKAVEPRGGSGGIGTKAVKDDIIPFCQFRRQMRYTRHHVHGIAGRAEQAMRHALAFDRCAVRMHRQKALGKAYQVLFRQTAINAVVQEHIGTVTDGLDADRQCKGI